MFWLTVKLAVISLASISVFSSIDPEKFSDGLLRIGMPAQVSFSIAYWLSYFTYVNGRISQSFIVVSITWKSTRYQQDYYIGESIVLFYENI